jgi:hypothetical protein
MYFGGLNSRSKKFDFALSSHCYSTATDSHLKTSTSRCAMGGNSWESWLFTLVLTATLGVVIKEYASCVNNQV